MKPKYFIGPMSKNVVDTLIEFCNETNETAGLILSRRQVDYDGGYVNNWTTRQFSEYVKSKTDKVLLVRDHSGPGQGQIDDDGYSSLTEDCRYLDIIHIDPWKKYPTFTAGVKETIEMIKYCYNINPGILFEVGTEEAIRRFELHELEELIQQLKTNLTPEVYNRIKYIVIQSGTSLQGTDQTGIYSSDRLKEMINVCKRHSLTSKEHNGDYIAVSVIKEKFNLGLNSINIAPEFGLIETLTYLDEIEDDSVLEEYFQICYDSKKWVKWVNQDFNPFKNKVDLIRICGHYVLSDINFLKKIKSKFLNIDAKVKKNIKIKLEQLYGQ